ncbi:hypothetical protein ACFOUP_16800 [Belliella kenyensis]|uniref:Uncharacterized protein n=1 Tax=Belliella kenyensis TaxID=1472724 RepID=A0ABV8EQR8_9BACT|nr:hypothetical protein [Belliella kenyensis]MCH7402892.1 hypothetical protein [Belliella kenyensis]MDN3602598.1 hypothetical protein [Belliella kenyensis]
MDLEEIEFELPEPTHKTQEELEKIWLENLKSNFKNSIAKYKPLAIKNNWVLPTDPVSLFNQYFQELEKETLEKYKDNPTSLKRGLDNLDKDEILLEFDNVELELYPIYYELVDFSTLRFPKPEIPENYILIYISEKKEELLNLGLFLLEKQVSDLKKIPSKSNSTRKFDKPFRNDLKLAFQNQFGNDSKYFELLNCLFKQGLLSDDLSVWVGTKENGKIQLASLIKWVGLKELTIKFTEKEVKEIAKKNFGLPISLSSVKASKPEDGEYYHKKC